MPSRPSFKQPGAARSLLRPLGLALALLAAVVTLGYRAFRRMVRRDVAMLFGSLPQTETLVDEAQLAHLPPPVQRYLRYAGVVGKPIMDRISLAQRGMMRTRPDAAWQPFTAQQHISTRSIGFVWDATMYMLGLPVVRIRDRYLNGNGEMLVKLGALLPVVRARGEELDEGTLVRYLAEMIWFPSALLRHAISFNPVDEHTARVTLSDCGRSVSGTMHFDDEGRLAEFRTIRLMLVDGRYERHPWSAVVDDYRELAGVRIPVKARVTWQLPEGPFEWLRLTIIHLSSSPAMVEPCCAVSRLAEPGREAAEVGVALDEAPSVPGSCTPLSPLRA